MISSLFKVRPSSNALWSVAAALSSKSINFLSVLIVARMLGPKTFGQYTVMITTAGMYNTIAGFGLGLTATKFLAELAATRKGEIRAAVNTFYTFGIVLSVVFTGVTYLLADWASSTLLHSPELIGLLQLTSSVIVFDGITAIQTGVLAAFDRYKYITAFNLINGLASFILTIYSTYNYGLWGACMSLVGSRILQTVVSSFYVRKVIETPKRRYGKPTIKRRMFAEVLRMAFPAYLTNLVNTPIQWITTAILVNQSNGYYQLGLFNATNQLRQIVMFLPDSAGRVSIPALARLYVSGEKNDFNKVALKTTQSNAAGAILPAVAILIISPLFRMVVGREFDVTITLISLVLLTGILNAITNALGYIFICSNRIWLDVFYRVVWGIVIVGTLLLFGKHLGAVGYAVCYVIGFTAYGILQFVSIKNSLLTPGVDK